ncbi:hypothetical protein RBH29_03345 [Herbivorax sp. ANBcel31]|uniref:hypothetical protein n=1 Tax=Herbivorax sp. ANBcel31 TaxID=3069754 RepID=UPI0027AEED8D|nr:hypothetical protein [Herbivorax sp. ANBcel31]MDQ2085466.1 hypothetical protein [Herbivorax sp. ANBcel31]
MVKRIFYILLCIISLTILLNACSERVPEAPSPSDAKEQDGGEGILSKDREREQIDKESQKENFNTDIGEPEKEQISDPHIEEVYIEEVWDEVPIMQKEFSKSRVYYSISESGELLSGEFDEPESDIYEMDTTLKITDIYTGVEEKIKVVEWPMQIWNADINSEWVIWVEGIAEGISGRDYEVYAYNRETKDIKLYFTTRRDDGESIMVHTPKPSLKENEFLIDVVSVCNEDGNRNITSRKYNLTTGNYKEIAEQFALPSWSKNGYIGMIQDKELMEASIIAELVDDSLNPLTDKGLYIHEYLTDGEAVAVVGQEFDDDKGIRTIKRNMWLIEDGQKKLIKKAGLGGGCGWPKMSNRFIIWTTEGKAYAYDRKRNYIIKMSDEYNSYARLTNNNYISWLTPTEQEIQEPTGSYSILNIVKIEDIP